MSQLNAMKKDIITMTSDADRARARTLADMRNRIGAKTKRYSDTKSTWQTNYEGALGEIEFANQFGLPYNMEDKPQGDDGIDFTIAIKGYAVTFDVKTAEIPKYLYVRTTHIKTCADFLVLAQYHPHLDAAELVGWQAGNAMRIALVRKSSKGVNNHQCEHYRLYDIAWLREILTEHDQ